MLIKLPFKIYDENSQVNKKINKQPSSLPTEVKEVFTSAIRGIKR